MRLARPAIFDYAAVIVLRRPTTTPKRRMPDEKKRRRPKQNKADKTRPTELALMIIPVRGRKPNFKTVKAENG